MRINFGEYINIELEYKMDSLSFSVMCLNERMVSDWFCVLVLKHHVTY